MESNFILKLSRFRFWLYLGGTYLVGYALGSTSISDFLSLNFVIHFIYFLIPANIFLYGVNDYFDRDTDSLNLKKYTKEIRASDKNSNQIAFLVKLSFFLSCLLFIFETNIERVILLVFLLLSFFYSAPPLRFKSRVLVDFLSNILYALPGILGYYQLTNLFPDAYILLGLLAWTSAMHLFSAIPDILADKKANVITSAVFFGRNASLFLCTLFWLIFCTIILLKIPFQIFSLLCLIYPLMPLLSLMQNKISIDSLYWYFPYINSVLGFVAFFLIVLSKGYA